MSAKYLWESGSLILVTLGTLNFLYTFFSDKFTSRNINVIDEIKSSHMKLTKETTMWKAWIGFNASHSSGAMPSGQKSWLIKCRLSKVVES
ncbi:MAG: hypothetical protein ACI9J3_002505 [Parvicellaceae bacterium]|jgi:hypothetical protein